MTEHLKEGHVHRLVFTTDRNVICLNLDCDFRLTQRDVFARINATERLSTEYVRALIGELEARGYDNLVALTAYADTLEGK